MNKPLTNSTCNYACHNVEQSGEGMIILAWTVQDNVGVASGLLVKALDCRSKRLGFQSHLQQRFISLPGALSPTPKIE